MAPVYVFQFCAILVLIVKSASNISCPTKQPCNIDCTTTQCQHSLINATLSTSLTISCGNCEFAVIICPSSPSSTNCIINIDDKGENASWTTRRSSYLSIFGGSNNNKMEVNVNHESSFHHSSILCGSNSSCIINCNNLETCMNIEVNTTYNTSTNINCMGINSCNLLDGINSIKSIDNDKLLNIQCFGYTRCNWQIFNITGDILVNTTADSYESIYNLPIFMHIDSVNSNSVKIYVENTTFISHNGIYVNNTKSVDLYVSNAPWDIYGIKYFGGKGYFEGNIYAQNAKQFNLYCGGNKGSCSKGKFYISSVASKITCDNYGCWDLSLYSKNGLDKHVIIDEDHNCLCNSNSSLNDNSCIANWSILCGDNYENKSIFTNGNKCLPSSCCGDIVEETKGKFHCESNGSDYKVNQAGRILIIICGFVVLCLLSSACMWCGTKKSPKVEDQQKEPFIN